MAFPVGTSIDFRNIRFSRYKVPVGWSGVNDADVGNIVLLVLP